MNAVEDKKVERVLTASDRCDACGAQAFVVANFLTGFLMFCGHHYAKWQEKIDTTAFEIEDSRKTINTKASSSA
jgi:hypothetical protein